MQKAGSPQASCFSFPLHPDASGEQRNQLLVHDVNQAEVAHLDRRDDRHDRRDQRQAYRHGYHDGRRDDRRYDRRYDDRRYYAPPRVVYRPAPHYHRWAVGQRYRDYYRGPVYVVNDYGHYHVRRPPRGYHWVRDDRGNLLMVAIATGIIADLLLHH